MAVTYGGAPSAPELVRKIAEAFPGSQPGNGWGMTETTATFTSHLGKDYENRPDSAGPAAPVGEMQIRDPADGAHRPADRRGRRAVGQGPAGGEGLLEQAGGHGGDLRRRLAAHRRPGAARRGGLPATSSTGPRTC